MAKKLKVADLPEFDAAEYLDSEEAVAAYLTAMIEDGDPALLAAALGDIAKASGLTREALYKALRADAQPRFDAINRVLCCAWCETSCAAYLALKDCASRDEFPTT